MAQTAKRSSRHYRAAAFKAPSGTRKQRGAGCGCGLRGGYRATKKNLKYLKRWKQGKSIGFTMTASLKAKGLIPRTSKANRGKKVLGSKYR